METNFNRPSDPEELGTTQDNSEMLASAEDNQENLDNPETRKRVKHEDHHVNRKYRLFSNHSSYGDSPHTNTSF